MSGRDALGFTVLFLVYAAFIAGLWLVRRRELERRRREKSTGRLPARRSPSSPRPINPALMATAGLLWAFLPLVGWAGAVTLMRLIAPPEAQEYLTPRPTFSQVVRMNLWWLFWSGLVGLGCMAIWIGVWLARWLADPAVSRAEELMRAGQADDAVQVLREAIGARGPTIARWNALANALMALERWSEALQVSLDIEDRNHLHPENRRRKALALFKLGRPELAFSEFKPSGAKPARRLAEVCAYCQGLIELGLFDRAWDQLRRAEVLYGRGTIPVDKRPDVRKQIDACRARLAGHFADEKPGGLDEIGADLL